MKPIPIKRAKKADREHRVLMGLIELYLEAGKPIGSNTLREAGFDDLSSATIRNYFAHLEERGLLQQQHVSGGRVPTALAFELYAQENLQGSEVDGEIAKRLAELNLETKEVAAYLQHATEVLSEVTECAAFLSSPRFDHDFVLEVRVVPLDPSRCLCALVTDFGSVLTEVMHTEERIDEQAAKRIEGYFTWRVQGHEKPQGLSHKELATAQRFYNELMVRYITRYSSFTEEDVVRTGFSRLLAYPEFQDPAALASGLSLFESGSNMATLLRQCQHRGDLTHWIGNQQVGGHCAVLAAPYAIHGTPVGGAGILGPTRLPYRDLFGILRLFSKNVSETLSKSLYKFRIHYRQPQAGMLYLEEKQQKLLEDRR